MYPSDFGIQLCPDLPHVQTGLGPFMPSWLINDVSSTPQVSRHLLSDCPYRAAVVTSLSGCASDASCSHAGEFLSELPGK